MFTHLLKLFSLIAIFIFILAVKIVYELRGKPIECQTTHHFECPCIFGGQNDRNRQRYFRIMEKWQQVVEDVSSLKEFDQDDFAVVNQPFLKHVQFPRVSNGDHDYTYMSVDCFHLSQKGYARATNALWNNMFEPIGNKSNNWNDEFKHFECPTVGHPFIRTPHNG